MLAAILQNVQVRRQQFDVCFQKTFVFKTWGESNCILVEAVRLGVNE